MATLIMIFLVHRFLDSARCVYRALYRAMNEAYCAGNWLSDYANKAPANSFRHAFSSFFLPSNDRLVK